MGEELVVVDDGVLRRFDFRGQARSSTKLSPPLREIDRVTKDCVTSLDFASAGMLIGLEETRSVKDTDFPSLLRLYAEEGDRLLQEREVPLIAHIARAFVSPHGDILVYGLLNRGWDYHVNLAGMTKRIGRPGPLGSAGLWGLVRFTDWSAEPEVLITGLDDVVPFRDGLLGYSGDLVEAQYEELVAWGVAQFRHQVLFELSWDGKVVATYDVSDGEIGADKLMLGQPLGDRLVLASTVQVYELDFSQLADRRQP